MKCKNGPGCKNHDWGRNSPVRLVCKNGPGCRRHDWGNNRNPLDIKCFMGEDDCANHNWDGVLTRHSINTCDKKQKTIKVKKVKNAEP